MVPNRVGLFDRGSMSCLVILTSPPDFSLDTAHKINKKVKIPPLETTLCIFLKYRGKSHSGIKQKLHQNKKERQERN